LIREPAARAALTATLIMGCRLGDISCSEELKKTAAMANYL
jgi:hypothetical protein